MLKIVLMHAFNASTFSFNKVLLMGLPPLLLAGISSLAGGGLLLISVLHKKSRALLLNWRTLLQLLPFAICVTYLAGFLRFYALSHLSSYYMSFFSAFDPFLTALLCYGLKSQKLRSVQIAGIILATLGSLPLLLSNTSQTMQQVLSPSFLPIPIIAALGAIIVNRYGWIQVNDIITEAGYSVSEVVSFSTLIGGVLSLGTSFFAEMKCVSFSCLFSFSFLGMLIYVILVSTLVCSRTYASLLKHYNVTFLSLTEFLTPLFVALYGWLFLHETITWHFFVSTALVVAGLYVFSYPALVQKKH